MHFDRVVLVSSAVLFLSSFAGAADHQLALAGEGMSSAWSNEVISVYFALEPDLDLAVKVTNVGAGPLIVPQPMIMPLSSLTIGELFKEDGSALRAKGIHVDWPCDSVPFLKLAPGESGSTTFHLATEFPGLHPGKYTLKLFYRSPKCGHFTWSGSAVLEDLGVTVINASQE